MMQNLPRRIRWRNQYVDVDIAEDSLVSELKFRLCEVTSIDPSRMRILSDGRILVDNAKVPLSPLTLVGSNDVLVGSDDSLLRNDLLDEPINRRYCVSVSQLIEEYDRRSINTQYKFHKLDVLPGLPDRNKAMSILEQLSRDPGILAVMQKYHWSVGALVEMFPEGYVGVSEVCILGLNENKGQTIRLRLRTDDLKVF